VLAERIAKPIYNGSRSWSQAFSLSSQKGRPVDTHRLYPIRYDMFDVQTTELFDKWLSDLTNRAARARITSRIDRLSCGNPGDVKAVGEGISEMRIDTGPGYRVYYKQTGTTIIVILCGGDKSSQDKDIKKAKQIAAEL
jgi:putative addiction module killer protein